jgi:hypothetical protein
MKKIYFQRWVFGKMQDIQTSIEVLDGYNKTRYSRKKIKDEQLLIEAAKYAHENGLIYFVTILENEKPFCFLEINKGFYSVNFLDDSLRVFMAYSFYGNNYDETYKDKLFLGQIYFWEFKGTTDEMTKITDCRFKSDGSFHTIERNLVTNEQIDSEAKNKIDVSSNWEEYPDFGKYDSLIRRERNSNQI